MSTHFNISNKISSKGALTTGVLILFSIMAWQGSTSSGGERTTAVNEIMKHVVKNDKLTHLCQKIGEELIDASIRRQISKLRPTAKIWKKQETKVSAVWISAQCPVAPLATISYGAIRFASADDNRRKNIKRGL